MWYQVVSDEVGTILAVFPGESLAEAQEFARKYELQTDSIARDGHAYRHTVLTNERFGGQTPTVGGTISMKGYVYGV